jgi:hypothetical protein
VSAFHTSQLPGSRSSDLIFQVGPSLQNPETTADKFAGSLFFWVGPSLQNPEKTAKKSEFQKKWTSPSFKIPRNCNKICISRFFWSPKNRRKPQKNQILKPLHCGKTTKNFWTSLSFKIPRHHGKSVYQDFSCPLKIARTTEKSKF